MKELAQAVQHNRLEINATFQRLLQQFHNKTCPLFLQAQTNPICCKRTTFVFSEYHLRQFVGRLTWKTNFEKVQKKEAEAEIVSREESSFVNWFGCLLVGTLDR